MKREKVEQKWQQQREQRFNSIFCVQNDSSTPQFEIFLLSLKFALLLIPEHFLLHYVEVNIIVEVLQFLNFDIIHKEVEYC